jgi:hypothetical protein
MGIVRKKIQTLVAQGRSSFPIFFGLCSLAVYLVVPSLFRTETEGNVMFPVVGSAHADATNCSCNCDIGGCDGSASSASGGGQCGDGSSSCGSSK